MKGFMIYELCPDCAKAVDEFITRSSRPATIDELRDFCNNFSKSCKECPFYYENPCDDRNDCELKSSPCNWSSDEEIFAKLLDYKLINPDRRKEGYE